MQSIKFSKEYWNDTESDIEFIHSNTFSSLLPITAVKAYIIKNEQLLLTKVKRGWDLPGGHIEEGETPEEALVREVMEETGGLLKNYSLLGYIKILTKKDNDLNKDYPKESIMLHYLCTDIQLNYNHKFNDYEAQEARFTPFQDIHKYHHNWTKMKQQILDLAKEKVANK